VTSGPAVWGLTPRLALAGRSKRGKRIATPLSVVARRLRVTPGGYVYHVCNRGSRKGVIAHTYEDYCVFLTTVELARQKFGMRIIAYNVIENHFHFLLWPLNDRDIPRFMKWMEQTHAQRFHRQRGTTGCGAVYQSRYFSRRVTEDRKFLTALRYVESNARRHGLVERAEQWLWCSAWAGDPIGPRVVIEESPIPRPANWIDVLNDI
jgi:putative transposase